jgi:hypothetical protein
MKELVALRATHNSHVSDDLCNLKVDYELVVDSDNRLEAQLKESRATLARVERSLEASKDG